MEISSRVFSEIIETCDGMLAPQVYARIYEAARRGGIIVEVGTAMGASTVALALGLRDSGKPGHVYTFDPMAGGPRRSLASVALRLERINENLDRYGVKDMVTITVGDLSDGCPIPLAERSVSVLMLDADGRIDRDLLALQNNLKDDCSLIIDDVSDKVRVKRRWSRYRVDSKMRLSFLMIEMMKNAGKISSGNRLINTYFGEILPGNGEILDRAAALEVYRQLVFQSADASSLQWIKNHLLGGLTALSPDWAAKSRRLYRHFKYRQDEKWTFTD